MLQHHNPTKNASIDYGRNDLQWPDEFFAYLTNSTTTKCTLELVRQAV